MQKKLLIRADGNAVIGAGHIMRCVSIGNEAKKLGIDVLFVTADKSFLPVLTRNKFRISVLGSEYNKMENVLDEIIAVINEEKPDVMILDSYFATARYMMTLNGIVKLAYIDDVLTFPYPVDTLINYNIYASRENYKRLYYIKNLPKMLLGCSYMPLRDEFQSGKIIKINKQVKNVLFSAGGADPERIALRFVRSIVLNRQLSDTVFHIILGSFEPDIDEIEEIGLHHHNIVTHSNISCMSELMLQCDLAISAAGSTLYELCACGVPTITYVLDDNQVPGATAFSDLGVMINAGDYLFDSDLIKNIIDKMSNVSSDVLKRLEMQSKGLSIIDGKGAKRIIQEIM